ncbi:MAG: acetyl-CoA carboxylase biotin carboxylase subunit [Bacteroidales bacterium]|nr:acetyl-CoA carboxylase biotin carboxylase subunit [Bacteroidales bacterium]MCF8458278.1 acetyl-CoA carboxylase biotin carboxylase subunit [Bacteroidales bacterium]
MKLFDKILIANRGEIAVRVIRSAKKLGIKTVAVYSDADEDALHVYMADEAYHLGSNELHDSYLNMDKIIRTALLSKAEAIHPGYGFMSERAEFARKCKEAGLVFIGPDPESIHLMGNKIEARKFAKSLNVPMTEGFTGTHKDLKKAAQNMDFPVLLKAAAGGGGKGMRIVRSIEELDMAIETTSREALNYFGDGSIFIEKFIENPRHIEFQIIGDHFGNVVHLFERECSIQRRYQKIIEESPSPTLTEEVRAKMGEVAVRIGKGINYKNAGTIEFLVDERLNFYFLEMNTRVQVEHPVTEEVTGIDIVEEQIIIAAGNPMRFKQSDIKQKGHAIECRIYAEDPERNFMPSPGTMNAYHEPSGNGIRIDTGIAKATTIHSFFDPMVSKLIVFGSDREIARKRSVAALKEYVIHGIKTNIPYLIALLEDKHFINNKISTNYCDTQSQGLIDKIEADKKDVPEHIVIFTFLMFSLNNKNGKVGPSVWERIGYWRHNMEIVVVLEEKEHTISIKKITGKQYKFELNGTSYFALLKNIECQSIEIILNDFHYKAHIFYEKTGDTWLNLNGNIFSLKRKDILTEEKILGSGTDGEFGGTISSPMPGKVIKLSKEEDSNFKKGEVLLIVESMKMENNILAPFNGKLIAYKVKVGDMVDGSSQLVDFEIAEEKVEA